MKWLIDAWEWLAYSSEAMLVGGTLALIMSFAFMIRSDRAFKEGFEIESIRLMLHCLFWAIIFVWWKV